MKRILFFSIFAALLCGCIPAGNNGRGSATDTISSDSVGNVVVADPEPAEPEPEEPDPPFTSPDLKTFRLQGHVKQVVERIDDYSEVYKFDRQGKLLPDKIRSGQSGNTQIERNKAGQIYSRVWIIDEDMVHYYMYKYNNAGYVQSELLCSEVEECFFEHIFVLNEKGWIVSATRKSILAEDLKFDYYEGKDVYERFKDKYSYSVIDEQGNWLKAIVKTTGRTYENKSYSGTYIITRKITYWE